MSSQTQPPKFRFNGGITLEEYKKEWRADIEKARGIFEQLKAFEGEPTMEDFGKLMNDLDVVYTDGSGQGGLFNKLLPDEQMRKEGELAENEFDKLGAEVRLSPEYAHNLAKMSVKGLENDPVKKRFIETSQDNIKLSGALLPQEDRKALKMVEDQLTDVVAAFKRNIADGVTSYFVHLNNLEGAPEDFLQTHPANEDGLVEIKTRRVETNPILKYVKNDDTRKKAITEQLLVGYPENEAVLKKMIELKNRKAQIMGYGNYSEYSLAGHLSLKSADTVSQWIDDVYSVVKPRADQENAALARLFGVPELKQWQSHFAEQILMRKVLDGFDSSQARPYLRADVVLPALTELIQEVFGVRFEQQKDVASWDEHVTCYNVFDETTKELLGRLYTDLRPRDNKYSHACVGELIASKPGEQVGECFLIANIAAGEGALMEFDQVTTVFHEFGHAIHLLVSFKIPYTRLGGFSVENDFVEAPSQFLEELIAEPETIKRFAIDASGNVIPDDMITKLIQSAELTRGIFLRSQLAFSKLGLEYYRKPLVDGTYPEPTANLWHAIIKERGNYPAIDGAQPQASFGHLAADNYGPRYYSYQFALSMAKDFASVFKSAPGGMLNKDLLKRYRSKVLEVGATKSAMEIAEDFLGRPINPKALESWLQDGIDLSKIE